jgi:hypothetical protein
LYTSYLFLKMTLFDDEIGGVFIEPLKTDFKKGVYLGPKLTKVAEVNSFYII